MTATDSNNQTAPPEATHADSAGCAPRTGSALLRESAIVRGKPKNPVGFKYNEDVIRLKTCPDCAGRGWYLIEPFRSGGSNGVGGLGNLCQCETCKNSMAYWQAHGCLPPEIEEAITKKQNTEDQRTGE